MNAPIAKSIEVRCAVAHAFKTFTRQIDRWWPPSHRRFEGSTLILEPGVGGRFLERGESDEIIHGHVRIWEPPARLSYTWQPGSDLGPTTVDIEFSDLGDGRTRVAVVHSEGDSGLGERWPKSAERFERAWSHLLPIYLTYIEDQHEV